LGGAGDVIGRERKFKQKRPVAHDWHAQVAIKKIATPKALSGVSLVKVRICQTGGLAGAWRQATDMETPAL